MKKPRVPEVIKLRCKACGMARVESDLRCVSYEPIYNVTSHFRYCKDNPACRDKASVYVREKLLP